MSSKNFLVMMLSFLMVFSISCSKDESSDEKEKTVTITMQPYLLISQGTDPYIRFVTKMDSTDESLFPNIMAYDSDDDTLIEITKTDPLTFNFDDEDYVHHIITCTIVSAALHSLKDITGEIIEGVPLSDLSEIADAEDLSYYPSDTEPVDPILYRVTKSIEDSESVTFPIKQKFTEDELNLDDDNDFRKKSFMNSYVSKNRIINKRKN